MEKWTLKLNMKNNNIAYSILFFILCLGISDALAQATRCGTVVTREQVAFELSQLSNARSIIAEKINKTLSIHAYIILDSLGNPTFSNQDILDAIEEASEAFAPIGLSFKVCEFTIIENWQYSEWTDVETEPEVTTLYWQDNVINMYFPLTILSPIDAGGYAYFPGGPDVIVINELSAILHELGHFFGLYHTFETQFGVEAIPRTNCLTAGDLLCDTEADPEGDENNLDMLCEYTIPAPPGSPGNWYLPPTDNIMSYYGDCRCKFTPDQYNRMVQQYLTLRSYLW